MFIVLMAGGGDQYFLPNTKIDTSICDHPREPGHVSPAEALDRLGDGKSLLQKGRQVHYLFSSSEAFMQEVNLKRVSKENAIKGLREAPHAIFKG